MPRPRKDALPGTLPVQPTLDGMCRSDKLPEAPRRPEQVLQQHTRGILATLGYASMETGVTRKAVECECPKCHLKWKFTPTGWQGNTPGFPDLSVFRSVNFPGVFIQIEMKGDGTPITREQQLLADQGRSVICYSEAEALEAVMKAERAMHAYQFPAEREERITSFLRMNARQLGRR